MINKPNPSYNPPSTEREVVGFFDDHQGSELVWNWVPVYYSNGKYLSCADDADYTRLIS